MGLLWEVHCTFAKCSVSLVTSLIFPMPSSKLAWSPFRPPCTERKGRLRERNPENGVYCGLCTSTKIDAGNIREQHCWQHNPARLFWKLASIFIACIPWRAANQCQCKQSNKGERSPWEVRLIYTLQGKESWNLRILESQNHSSGVGKPT